MNSIALTTATSFPAYTAILTLPCCRLGVRTNASHELTALVFLPPDTPVLAATFAHDLIASIENNLSAWQENSRHTFGLPLANCGTPFQQRTWQAISRIPHGEIRTYGELSTEIGGMPRAVGQACGANPFPILVPCHRVVAKTGIGGFANARDGWLLETKRWLLKHEGVL